MSWNPTLFQSWNTKKHDLAVLAGTTDLRLSLSNTVPDAANDALWADLSADEIANGNGYTTGGYTVTHAEDGTGGTFDITIDGNITIAASGGAIGPFTYAILRDSVATGQPLIMYFTRSEGADTVSDGNSKVINTDGVTVVSDAYPV